MRCDDRGTDALIVTWQAGGGAQAAIGLGRLLAEQGHGVRILAPADYPARVAAARRTWDTRNCSAESREPFGGMDARVLVLTGLELAPEEVRLAPEVEVRDYVPHAAALPEASLVITHAGTGTLLAAFASGVPVLCLPLGRDQLANARRVEEVGLGRALSQEADEPTIRASVSEALASPELGARAAWMAEVIRGYGGGSRAVTALECVTSASE